MNLHADMQRVRSMRFSRLHGECFIGTHDAREVITGWIGDQLGMMSVVPPAFFQYVLNNIYGL